MVQPTGSLRLDPRPSPPGAGDPALGNLVLTEVELHLWEVPMRSASTLADTLRTLLSPGEVTESRRLRFEADRARFVCRRGAVRTILSRYSGVPPGCLQFCSGRNGKPQLAGRSAVDGIRFNVSRCEDLALVAVTLRRDVGVDVEALRPIPDALNVARSYFSPAEQAALRAVPAAARSAAFLRCWTRKEAFVKALGAGLSYPLHEFDVTLSPDEPAEILQLRGALEAAEDWSLASLQPVGGHLAAVAVRGPSPVLTTRHWLGEAA